MVSKARAQRIALRIHETLADILLREVSDPRLVGLTITGVDVDRELAYATIYVSGLDKSGAEAEVLSVLKGASGFLRTALAERIALRSFPRLRFKWDDSTERGARIEELLDQLDQEQEPGRDSEA